MSDKTIEELKAELEQSKTASTKAVEEATKPLLESIATLEQNVTAGATESKNLLAQKDKDFASLSAEREAAVKSYAELAKKFNPAVPAELVTGNSIAEIDIALGKAVKLVDQVKQSLDSQQQSDNEKTKVPAGSPGRQEPDLSTMTSKEKITYGLEKAKKK